MVVVASAVAFGIVVAFATSREPAPQPPTVAAAPGDEMVVSELTTVALGHRRAVEFLHSDAARLRLHDAAMRAAASVVRVRCSWTEKRINPANQPGGGITKQTVTSKRSSGTGVVVGRRRVLTARHLVPSGWEDTEVSILLADGTRVPATVIGRGAAESDASESDWVVLDVGPTAPALPAPLTLSSPRHGETVVAIGFSYDVGLAPDGRAFLNAVGVAGAPSWAVGRITSSAGTSFELLAGGIPFDGAGGGPVVEASGRVVGIVTGWSSSSTVVSGASPVTTRSYVVTATPFGAAINRCIDSDARPR